MSVAGPEIAVAPKPRTRIQREKREAILEAALTVFSAMGFRGATVDQIAEVAGLSKPNLLYYFPTKEEMHTTLLERLLETWLEPLHRLDPEGEPVEEILRYVARKLEMARAYPRESRLFATEILQGAPRILPDLEGPLRALVARKAAVIRGWSEAGRIAPVDAEHLIFSIWATTQHYADFDVQVRAVMPEAPGDPQTDAGPDRAAAHLETLFRRMLVVPV